MSSARKKAVENHRKRLRARGLVRLEVQAPAADAPLIRRIAEALRGDPEQANKARNRLRNAVGAERKPSLLELLAVDVDIDLDEFLTRERDLGRDVEL